MNKLTIAAAVCAALTSCNMNNPLLEKSTLEYGAPQFDKIKAEHYMPAFRQGIKEAKADIDAIVSNPEPPTFGNTIEALEFSGMTLTQIEEIFFAVKEAHSSEELENIAMEVTPLLTEFSMYVSLNADLFARVKAVYDGKDGLNLDAEQERLLEKTYRGFVRGGANLNDEDKETFSKLSEELSLTTLKFGKNVLDATNAFALNITDSADLAGLPDYVVALGSQTAKEKGQEGWTFDLSYPSFGPFLKFSEKRELREKMWMAYNTRAVGGEFDNTDVVRQIAQLRLRIANILGYATYADFALEERMLKSPGEVDDFLTSLLEPSIGPARKEVETVFKYAKSCGFEDSELKAWDFSYWSEKYQNEKYSLSVSDLKPYFRLEDCIDAVLGLAGRLYGISFEQRNDLPVYQEDVKVFDVKDGNGEHLALLYADFFPRASKRGGAWMTEYRGQWIKDGVETRPIITLVTNFSKPTSDAPSLLTHDELVTFLHEFGHCLHGMLSKGRYPSLTCTGVSRDFVELPSQIMENFAFEPEFLQGSAKHYLTGEVIPSSLIDKVVASKNYLAAYYQVRQLSFGILDMAWHELPEMTDLTTLDFESKVAPRTQVLPFVPGTSTSCSITHLFSGGYAAGYYSYKWAEVLEADAFSLFKEKGIFNPEVSTSFRENILSKGGSIDEAEMFRNFRGRDPKPEALLKKLGIRKVR